MSPIRTTLLALAVLISAALPAQAGVVPTHHAAVVLVPAASIRVVVHPLRYVTRRVTVRLPYRYKVVSWHTSTRRSWQGHTLVTVTRSTPVTTWKTGYRSEVRSVQVAVRL